MVPTEKKIVLILSFLCFFTLPEVVVLDFWLGPLLKQLLNSFCFILLSLSFLRFFLFGIYDYIFFALFVVNLILSTFTDVVMGLLSSYHLIKIYAIAKAIQAFSFKVDFKRINANKLYVILSLPAISFILFIIFGEVFINFTDNSGHEMYLIYSSLSSSIYTIGSLRFARMAFLFAEPGTYAVALGLLLLYFVRREKEFFIIGGLGLASLSLAHILGMLLSGLIIALRKLYEFVLLKGRVKTRLLLKLFIGFSCLTFVINSYSDTHFLEYLTGRIISVFAENNRSSGNFNAFRSILQHPFGLDYKSYSSRLFSSSGVLVLAAYFGIVAVLAYAVVIKMVLAIFNTEFVPSVLVLITVFSRNDLFTGYLLEILVLIPLIFNYKECREESQILSQ